MEHAVIKIVEEINSVVFDKTVSNTLLGHPYWQS